MDENDVLRERLEKIAALAGRPIRIDSAERQIAEARAEVGRLRAELDRERRRFAEAERTAYIIHRHYGTDGRGREVIKWGTTWSETFADAAATFVEAIDRSLARRAEHEAKLAEMSGS